MIKNLLSAQPMFIESLRGQDTEKVTVIGQFVRIEEPYVILNVGGTDTKVEHRGLDGYRTKYVMVSGTVQDGILVEDSTQAVEDGFDYAAYARLAAVCKHYPLLF